MNTELSPSDSAQAPEGSDLVLRVDQEHLSIRFLVPILTIGFTVFVHVVGITVLDALLASEGASALCIMLPLDVLALLVGGYLIERLLKRVMPSRRFLEVSHETIILTDGRKTPPRIQRLSWDGTINVAAWRFPVRRRTRIPKGWYCMAIRLLQDEEEIIFYTFMPPDEAEAVPSYDAFVRLRPRKETTSNTDLSGVAQQRRLLKLEDARWEGGAELERDDFNKVLRRMEQHISGW